MPQNNQQALNGLDDAENLTKLLGHLPPATFRAFMEKQFAIPMPTLDVKSRQKKQRHAMEEVLAALDATHRQKIEEAAEKLVLLSDGPGQDVIDGLCADIADETFSALGNQYERALWLYANQSELFKDALDARQADVFRQNTSCYSGFVAPKNLAVATDAATRHAFHDHVAQQLGCARDAVAVQLFRRLRPDTRTGDDVALYQVSIHHNLRPEIIDCVEASELVSQEVIRALSLHITYEPASGYIEVLSKDADGREALARIAADTLLQWPISGQKIPLKQYDYQSLAAARNFDVAGEPVSFVKVTELAYTEVDRTLMVKIGTKDPDDIYSASKMIVGPAFAFYQHQLSYAKLTIKLKKVSNERARTISIILRDANKCNIKTKREKDRALCDRLLAKWHLVKEIGDVLAEPADAIAA